MALIWPRLMEGAGDARPGALNPLSMLLGLIGVALAPLVAELSRR